MLYVEYLYGLVYGYRSDGITQGRVKNFDRNGGTYKI